MKVASIDRFDTVNIPRGNAAITVWFSGCSINCNNCHNPKLQDGSIGDDYTPTQLFDLILESVDKSGVDSVVLLGGEPLDQDNNDIEILCYLLNSIGMKIYLYTGYEFEDIRPRILRSLSWVKTGKYVESLKKQHNILASSNQSIWIKSNNKWRIQEV